MFIAALRRLQNISARSSAWAIVLTTASELMIKALLHVSGARAVPGSQQVRPQPRRGPRMPAFSNSTLLRARDGSRSVPYFATLAAFVLILSTLAVRSQPYGLTNAVPVGGFLNGILPSSAPNS